MNSKSVNEQHKILFLTQYFTRFPFIGGPIGERYVGLYNTFSETLSPEYDLYWYDETGVKLYRFAGNKYIMTKAWFLPTIILRLTQESVKQHKKFLVILSYPSACYGTSFLISMIFLLALKVLRLARIILDMHDVPAYPRRQTGRWKLSFLNIHEIICIGLASFVIVISQGWSEYFSQRNMKKEKMRIIPMGSFHRLITPTYEPLGNKLNVVYVGSVVKGRGIESLVECIERIRKKHYNIELLIVTAGTPKVYLPEREWLHLFPRVPTYRNMINILSTGDVGIIPYPVGSYWDRTFIGKMVLYMASGKPVISTNLPETRRIIDEWKCGMIAKNWADMEECIISIFGDRELGLLLGKNARKAAEKMYNWHTCTLKLDALVREVLSDEAYTPRGEVTRVCS